MRNIFSKRFLCPSVILLSLACVTAPVHASSLIVNPAAKAPQKELTIKGHKNGKQDDETQRKSGKGKAPSTSTSCPRDAMAAARTIWLLGSGMGKNKTRLVGKHRCGRWLQCVKRGNSVRGWQCNWSNSDPSRLLLK